MSDGFVKLHRSFLQWEWYQDEACRCLFLHLLLTVNWKPKRWRGNEIPAGSAPIGSEALAKQLGWNRAKLRRTMDKLKATGEVATKAANKWTLVTLVNWAKYQDDGQQSGQQNDTEAASKRPANGQQTATPKEGKKERREEGEEREERREISVQTPTIEIWPTFDDWWSLYDKKTGRAPCEEKWKRLKQDEKEAIMRHTEAYVAATPEIQYRKNPLTYLNQKSWNDEHVTRRDDPARPVTAKLERIQRMLAEREHRGAIPQARALGYADGERSE